MKPGDAIATVAQPIARGIDWMFGTDIQNCTGCSERQSMLNEGRYADAFYNFLFGKTQQTEENKTTMHYLIQLDVEAESVEEAMAKKSEGKTISINPRPEPRVISTAPGARSTSSGATSGYGQSGTM